MYGNPITQIHKSTETDTPRHPQTIAFVWRRLEIRYVSTAIKMLELMYHFFFGPLNIQTKNRCIVCVGVCITIEISYVDTPSAFVTIRSHPSGKYIDSFLMSYR